MKTKIALFSMIISFMSYSNGIPIRYEHYLEVIKDTFSLADVVEVKIKRKRKKTEKIYEKRYENNKLSSIREFYHGKEVRIKEYFYNTNGRLAHEKSNDLTTGVLYQVSYLYANDILAETKSFSSKDSSVCTVKLSYGNEGGLVSETVYYDEEPFFKYMFIQEDNHILSRKIEVIEYLKRNKKTDTIKIEYYDKKMNVRTVNRFEQGALSYTSVTLYDDDNNPLEISCSYKEGKDFYFMISRYNYGAFGKLNKVTTESIDPYKKKRITCLLYSYWE